MFASAFPIVNSSCNRRSTSVATASAMIRPSVDSGVIERNNRYAQWFDGCFTSIESIRIASGNGCKSAASVESRMNENVSRTNGQSGVK